MTMILPDPLILPETTMTGAGKCAALLPACARFGRCGLLVHGASLQTSGILLQILQSRPDTMEMHTWVHPGGEPTLDQLEQLLAFARSRPVQWVAAVGGGSVLDIAKSAALLFHATRPIADYHDGAAVEAPVLPFLAMPSTAGTGSEATVNAVLTNSQTGIKKSIRDTRCMARVVVLDPVLLRSCPPAVIAHSGMDAFTQAVEAYTSRYATWWSDQLALQASGLIATHLVPVYRGATGEAPLNLLLGSYLAGLALSMARLGVVHGLAHPLGAIYRVPHGQVCAVCLPYALEFNRGAIGAKYHALSHSVGEDLIQKVNACMHALSLQSPFAGQTLRCRDRIIAETLSSGSTRANPQPITSAEIDWFLTRLFGG